jgi:DNA-binding XRE family transcriptional regulator
MAVHIGKIIQKVVEEEKRLTQKQFGNLINKHEKTVPDIYDRATVSIDLLIAISEALNKDFLNVFYNEEPMKRLRDDVVSQLNNQIQKLIEENNHLKKELALTQDLREAQKEIIVFAKVQIEEYKLKLTELVKKVA